MGNSTSSDGSGSSANPWVIVFALTLFVIDVPVIGVLYHVANVYAAIGAGLVVNFAAAETVCRILGRPGGGLTTTLLRFARTLLATPSGAAAGVLS